MDGMEVQMQWKGGTLNQEEERKLIGRVFSNSRISPGVVKEHVMAAWKPKFQLDVTALGFNLFSFKFGCKEEAKRALEESPWVVRQNMLALERRKPYMCDSEIQIKTCAMWVQFHDLPPEGWMKVNVRGMAEKIGKIIEIEDPEDERYKNRNFCRARVEIDVERALVAVFKVPRPDDLPEAKVKARYEKLARFCYRCGKMGHDERTCEIEEVEDVSGENRRLYDASLCAPPYRAPQLPLARGSFLRPTPLRKEKQETKEVATRGTQESTVLSDRRESERSRAIGLCMTSMAQPVATVNTSDGAEMMGSLVGPSERKIQLGEDFGGKYFKANEFPFKEPSIWAIRPKQNYAKWEMGSSSNKVVLGTKIINQIEEELGEEGEAEAQVNDQQGQGEVREEEFIGALVNEVGRVNLKRSAEAEWTSSTGKRMKTYQQDSPGRSSQRQLVVEEIERWSRIDFREGGLGFNISSSNENGEFLNESVQINVEENISFVEGKKVERVRKYKYRSNKIKRALFVNVEEKGEENRRGGWPFAATKEP